MDTPMTENDVRMLENMSASCLPLPLDDVMVQIASRARALLVQRDGLVKERDDAVLRAQNAVNAEMKANEELTEIRHALGGFMGPRYGIVEEVKKVVAEREGQRKNMREVKVLLFPESEGSPVPHPVIVARVQHLLAEAASNAASSDTICRLSRERDTERAERQKAYQKLDEVSCERDTLAARASSLEAQVNELLKTHGTTALETSISATLADFGFHDEPGSTIVSRIREMGKSRDTLAARVKEIEERMAPYPSHLPERPALGLFACGVPGAVSSTAVDPAKPGLQPMKCPCGGKIEFGRERVGYCQKCGASCRVMDPPAPTQPHEGHMVHIPAEYCGKSSLMHAYADGYLAGKGAK